MASFKTWNGKINTKLLSTYGFYFTLNKDICKRYYCGFEIFQWEYDDCPIKDHYKYAKICDLNECLWFCKYNQNNPDSLYDDNNSIKITVNKYIFIFIIVYISLLFFKIMSL